MILLQLSAGQGPAECCLAVAKALARLEEEAQGLKVTLSLVEKVEGALRDTFKSVLYRLEGKNSLALAEKWSGTMQWICQSPYRPKHKRKNWFFTGSFSKHAETSFSKAIIYEACRSSGPGGQHANKTSSAVRATHIETGISVKVQSERSQHLNKRLAKALIELKLAEAKNQVDQIDKGNRHNSHHSIERGNARRVFKDVSFLE
jgi:peptide chain release factor